MTVHDVAFARHPEDFDPTWRRIALRTHRGAARRAGAIVAVSAATSRDAVAWLRAPVERMVTAVTAAQFWLARGRQVPKEDAEALMSTLAWRGIASFPLQGEAHAGPDTPID